LWIDNYYAPFEKQIKLLKEKYLDNKKAVSVFHESQKEIDDYKKYSEYFGYEFFVMRKNE
jgi:hypothetical protein